MSVETAPAPINQEVREAPAEQIPFLSLPGFDKLSPDRQAIFFKVPADKFNLVRPALEKEISELGETIKETGQGETKTFQANSNEKTADHREYQADDGIDAWQRAERGEPGAREDLLDAKRELTGEEPRDDEIFATLLENQSGFYDNDMILDVALSDSETQQHQDVLDLYKEFRGDLASVDEAISPEQQIDLFIEITKGNGSLPNRMFLARQSLTVLTANGTRNLSVGLKEFGVLGDGTLLDAGVDKLRKMASSSEVKAEYA